jgi:hypothetical protein
MGIKVNFKTNFFMDLFERREIPHVYDQILYLEENQILFENTGSSDVALQKVSDLYAIALIPEYFKPVLKNHRTFVEKTGQQNNLGYAILIKNIINTDSYLKTQFKSNSKNIKRGLTRLESCFNIRYEMFYGNMTKEQYLFIMGSLKEMLIQRFIQREDENQKLKEWNIILENTLKQILKKEASLYVIYDDDKPIDISLNYHYHKIIFSAISSYDIDYHKFGIGHVEIIKLIQWSLKEQYNVLELGYGDLEFKRRWCNHIYKFKYQVIYNQDVFLMPVIAKFHLYKLSLKEYLKTKKIDVLFKRVTSSMSKKTSSENDLSYEKITITDMDSLGDIVKVDLENENNRFLKRILYEFLYATVEHKNNTSIFEISKFPNSYLIKGKNNAQQIMPVEP